MSVFLNEQPASGRDDDVHDVSLCLYVTMLISHTSLHFVVLCFVLACVSAHTLVATEFTRYRIRMVTTSN